MTYQALYARQFHEQLMELPDSVYDKVEHSIDVLVDNPGLLRDYDPPYDAATPPVDCKWYYVPGTFKVLYLAADEAALQMRPLHRRHEGGPDASFRPHGGRWIGETKGRRSSDSASFQVHTGCTPAAKSA